MLVCSDGNDFGSSMEFRELNDPAAPTKVAIELNLQEKKPIKTMQTTKHNQSSTSLANAYDQPNMRVCTSGDWIVVSTIFF